VFLTRFIATQACICSSKRSTARSRTASQPLASPEQFSNAPCLGQDRRRLPGTYPDASSATKASARSQPQPCGAASRSPRPGHGIHTRTPPQTRESQPFSRSYGSNLTTSLTYIILTTRGFKPWIPDAEFVRARRKLLPSVFKGPSALTGPTENGRLIPVIRPYLEVNSFQGCPTVKKKRELFPGGREAGGGSYVLPLMPHRGNGILTVFPFGTTSDLDTAEAAERQVFGVNLFLRTD